MALETPKSPLTAIPIAEIADHLLANRRFLSQAHLNRFAKEFGGNNTAASFDASFDMAAEIGEQIKLARLLRDAVQGGGTPRDIKEAVTASNTHLSLLVKLQERVLNMNRIQKVEEATLLVLKTLDPALADKFTEELEKLLRG